LGRFRRADIAGSLDSFAELDQRSAPRNVGDASADQIALLMLSDVLINAGGLKLLQSQPDAPLAAIHLENHRAHRLPRFQDFLRMIDALLRADVADVNHALQ